MSTNMERTLREGAGAMMLERDGDGWRVARNYSECRDCGVGVAA